MSKRPSLAASMKAVGAQTTPPVAPIAESAPAPTPDRAEGKRYHAATRAGMKRVTVVVELRNIAGLSGCQPTPTAPLKTSCARRLLTCWQNIVLDCQQSGDAVRALKCNAMCHTFRGEEVA